MKDLSKIKYGYTHGGIFHADDVFATAFLKELVPDISIIRSNNLTATAGNEESIVYDIGGGEFDHHTPGTVEYRIPEKKIGPYASFGKIVRAFGHHYFESQKEQDTFDSLLVRGIDAHDCGAYGSSPNTLALAIASFNPTWEESDEGMAGHSSFLEAVALAQTIIRRTKAKAHAMVASEDAVNEALNKRDSGERFITLDKYVNYNAYLKNAPVDWVIYPSARGGWQLYSVLRDGENADLLPPEYQEDLKREGAIFVHPAGFTAVFDTKEKAVKAAKYRSWIHAIKTAAMIAKEDAPSLIGILG